MNAICDADYDQKMVEEVNGRLNELMIKFTTKNTKDTKNSSCSLCLCGEHLKLQFILRPETAEDYSSPKNLTIRSAIWMRFTGVPLDFSEFIPACAEHADRKPEGAPPICRQTRPNGCSSGRMEMFLGIQVLI